MSGQSVTNEKEKVILSHYKKLLEQRRFDEYDILGFLIFIRNYLTKKEYPYLHDFCDLVAHRDRDQGIAVRAISGAIQNGYAEVKGKKKIRGYHGIDAGRLEKEWMKLGSDFDIAIDSTIIQEITLCLFSLMQFSTYHNREHEDYRGEMRLIQLSDDCLALVTTEGAPASKYICFFKCGSFQFAKRYNVGLITSAVETVRVGTVLRLRNKNGEYII